MTRVIRYAAGHGHSARATRHGLEARATCWSSPCCFRPCSWLQVVAVEKALRRPSRRNRRNSSPSKSVSPIATRWDSGRRSKSLSAEAAFRDRPRPRQPGRQRRAELLVQRAGTLPGVSGAGHESPRLRPLRQESRRALAGVARRTHGACRRNIQFPPVSAGGPVPRRDRRRSTAHRCGGKKFPACKRPFPAGKALASERRRKSR